MARTALLFPSLLAGVGVALLIGCVIPSSSEHVDDHGHQWVASRGDRDVKPGTTTKEAVVALLGRPDVTMSDGRLLAYTWTTRSDVSFTGFVPHCGAWRDGEAPGVRSYGREETHYLLLEFDHAGTLHEKKLRHGGVINIYATSINDAML
jgi:hypothetical protein